LIAAVGAGVVLELLDQKARGFLVHIALIAVVGAGVVLELPVKKLKVS
jgi:uncharacterized membrane protein YeaQ/YmgE (transglycosylase-associated protein family)